MVVNVARNVTPFSHKTPIFHESSNEKIHENFNNIKLIYFKSRSDESHEANDRNCNSFLREAKNSFLGVQSYKRNFSLWIFCRIGTHFIWYLFSMNIIERKLFMLSYPGILIPNFVGTPNVQWPRSILHCPGMNRPTFATTDNDLHSVTYNKCTI